MDTNITSSEVQREFYLPATPVRSTTPGRLERFVTALLRDHTPSIGPIPEVERQRRAAPTPRK